ncbi:MAG: T9SS type A sorting domain-containing protein [Bacteroidia bacterium]|nr:T9SS type A sorting domain-containing protein [Bacteroidia bacterium]
MKVFFTLCAAIFLSASAFSQCQAVATAQPSTSCNPCNGVAIVSVWGGSPPYTYVWAPSGGNQQTATGLCAGTYTVIVTDAQGCVATATATVTSMGGVMAAAQCTPALCNQPGSAFGMATGGTPPYTYLWTPSGQTTQNATGLQSGCYTVTVTDAGGCTASASCCITVSSGPALSIQNVINANCPNCNGSATAIVSGGSAPYTFVWSNSQTNMTATSLCQGTYTVLVTDAQGCTASATVTIGCITGLDDEDVNGQELSLFPNPAHSALFISVLNHTGEVKVEIYTVIGEKVLSSSILVGAGESEWVNISSLRPGVYLLKIQKGSTSLVKKFLKE